MNLSLQQLAVIMPDAGSRANTYLGPLNDAMERFSIDSVQSQAAFLANVAVESGELRTTQESLYYKTPERIAQIWPTRFTAASAAPLARNPDALANAVYQDRGGNCEPGDGARFCGRGLLQITFRDTYSKASEDLGLDLLGNPKLVSDDPTTAALCAAWFFATHGCKELAEAGRFDDVCKRINGGTIGLDERRKYYRRALVALGA